MPAEGVDAKVVYQLLHDELLLGTSITLIAGWFTSDIRREPQYEFGVVRPHLGAR